MAMPPEQKALRKVLREIPSTMAQLARDSGVPAPNLVEARDGQRPVSAGVCRKVVATLRAWSGTCDRLADELEAVCEKGDQ